MFKGSMSRKEQLWHFPQLLVWHISTWPVCLPPIHCASWEAKVALCWIAWLRGCVPTVEQPRNSHLVYHPAVQWWIQWLSNMQASHKFGHLDVTSLADLSMLEPVFLFPYPRHVCFEAARLRPWRIWCSYPKANLDILSLWGGSGVPMPCCASCACRWATNSHCALWLQ